MEIVTLEVWILSKVKKYIGYSEIEEISGVFLFPEEAFGQNDTWIKVNDDLYELQVEFWQSQWEIRKWKVIGDFSDIGKQ